MEACRNTKETLIAVLIGAVLMGIIFTTQYIAQLHREVETGMVVLVHEYDTCLAAPDRTTDCVLEYDGDGSSNTPADWRWYWR